MKKMIMTCGFAALYACGTMAQETNGTPPVAPVNPNAAEITFDSETIDYGKIEYNSNGMRVFKFKNTGKEPLIITNARGSCGCTVPSWPKEPILPGKAGEIQVTYATNRVGAFTKTVTISSNAKTETKNLTIKGEVNPQPPEPTDPTLPVKKTEGVSAPLEKGN